ncbi:MAG: hypothetical protein J3K34DRAFT_426411 [Monoraphidium minutum]|nr:MAG: hypothetical protein J3K34DRAFT_426411 [Monoraphidium minutum]
MPRPSGSPPRRPSSPPPPPPATATARLNPSTAWRRTRARCCWPARRRRSGPRRSRQRSASCGRGAPTTPRRARYRTACATCSSCWAAARRGRAEARVAAGAELPRAARTRRRGFGGRPTSGRTYGTRSWQWASTRPWMTTAAAAARRWM